LAEREGAVNPRRHVEASRGEGSVVGTQKTTQSALGILPVIPVAIGGRKPEAQEPGLLSRGRCNLYFGLVLR
jgi:hypothetical protein